MSGIIPLGPPPVLTPLDAVNGKVRLNESAFGRWLNLLWEVLKGVGPQLRATATLDFPNTLAQTSSPLTITVLGATVGQPVSLAAPAAASGCTYRADVTAQDTVTVWFVNASAAPVNPAAALFSVIVQQ